MDNGLRYTAAMWREATDEVYRIQTNCPKVIRKLQKRTTTNKCGWTLKGSTKHFVVYQLRYNKPSSARQGFLRLTCQENLLFDADGDYFADLGPILDKNDQKMKPEVFDPWEEKKG